MHLISHIKTKHKTSKSRITPNNGSLTATLQNPTLIDNPVQLKNVVGCCISTTTGGFSAKKERKKSHSIKLLQNLKLKGVDSVQRVEKFSCVNALGSQDHILPRKRSSYLSASSNPVLTRQIWYAIYHVCMNYDVQPIFRPHTASPTSAHIKPQEPPNRYLTFVGRCTSRTPRLQRKLSSIARHC